MEHDRENFVVSVKGNIIHVKVFHLIKDLQLAIENVKVAENIILDILAKEPQKIFHSLVEILEQNKDEKMPKEALDMFVRLSNNKQLDKTAIVSSDLLMRLITNSVSYLTKKGDKTKSFANIDEARAWLKE